MVGQVDGGMEIGHGGAADGALGTEHGMAGRGGGEGGADGLDGLVLRALHDDAVAVESAEDGTTEEGGSILQGEGGAVEVDGGIDDLTGIVGIAGEVVVSAFPVADVEDVDAGVGGAGVHDVEVVGTDEGVVERGDVVVLHLAALASHVEAFDAKGLALVDEPLQGVGIVAHETAEGIGMVLGSLAQTALTEALQGYLVGGIDGGEDIDVAAYHVVQATDDVERGLVEGRGQRGDGVPRGGVVAPGDAGGALLKLHLQNVHIGLEEELQVGLDGCIALFLMAAIVDEEGGGDVTLGQRAGKERVHDFFLVRGHLRRRLASGQQEDDEGEE